MRVQRRAGTEFWQVSFLTLPAFAPAADSCYRDQPHAKSRPHRNEGAGSPIGTNGRCDSGSASSPKNTAAFSSGRRLRRPRHWPSPCEVQVPLGANRTADAHSELLLRMAHPNPNGASELFSLALRRLCHNLSKNLLRSSLPSAADLGHASRDVERFHRGIGTELGLLRW
jgi:hypothetical protein